MFNANDDKGLKWGRADSQLIRPKSCGSAIMVSDFSTEKDRFLCLREEEHHAVKKKISVKESYRVERVKRKIVDIRQVHEADGICSGELRQNTKKSKAITYSGFLISCHSAFSEDVLK